MCEIDKHYTPTEVAGIVRESRRSDGHDIGALFTGPLAFVQLASRYISRGETKKALEILAKAEASLKKGSEDAKGFKNRKIDDLDNLLELHNKELKAIEAYLEEQKEY
jgi:hypothetical protein